MGKERKVLMCFERAGNHWHVFFRTAPAPYIFPRRFVFADSYKIRDLFLRYGAIKLSEDMAAFDYAVGRARVSLTCFSLMSKSRCWNHRKPSQGEWGSMRPEESWADSFLSGTSDHL